MASADYLSGFAKPGEPLPDGEVPRIAIKTHLDGDPKPRQDEIDYFNETRSKFDIDEMYVLILVKDDTSEDEQFPGFVKHWWLLTDRGVEPTEMDLQIIPEGGDSVLGNIGGGRRL